jgi:ribosomal protein S8E
MLIFATKTDISQAQITNNPENDGCVNAVLLT